MGELQVLFEVPSYIEAGLASGQFQRVGGVIVASGSKQIVAWLRDGTFVDAAMKAANPVGAALEIGGTMFSLLDGHLTRRAIDQLARSTELLANVTVGGHLITLALATSNFRAINKRLDHLTEAVNSLDERIQAEFDRDRDTRFRVALEAARDAFLTQNEATRNTAIRPAIDGLVEAMLNFFKDLDQLLANPTPERLLLADQILSRAIYAEISRLQCYLLNGDVEQAKSRLREDIPKFAYYVERLTQSWLGKNAAIYFYKDVPSVQLARFLDVQQYFLSTDGNDATALFQVIDSLRDQFWDDAVFNVSRIKRYTTHRSRPLTDEDLEHLEQRLSHAERLIENLDRLLGFEMEISSMRLSYDEWTDLVSDEELDEHGIGLIVDEDLLREMEARENRLSQQL